MSENFSAFDSYPIKRSLEAVDSSDALILLLGHRYGFIPEGSVISVSEMEYRRPVERTKPVFVFITADDYPITIRSVERDPTAIHRLEQFKHEVRRNRLVHLFSSPEDLQTQVTQAFYDFTRTREQPGDGSELKRKLDECHRERQTYLETIESLRSRLNRNVPADPIWRGRNFEVDRSLCFVLMPFRDQFFETYEAGIQPAVSDAGLTALHAGEIFGNREIVEDIWVSICKTRLVVADVTGRNPNVFYELGISHTLGKECIVITQEHDDVPFDIRHRRYVHYHPHKDK